MSMPLYLGRIRRRRPAVFGLLHHLAMASVILRLKPSIGTNVDAFCKWKFGVEFLYIYLDVTGAVAKNATIGPLAGIEPAALRFRCSALTN